VELFIYFPDTSHTPVARASAPEGDLPVKTSIREEWMKLCEQAATEQNPERLMELIGKINYILDEKEKRLKLERHGATDI
jgi:hypothetical protein